MSRLLPNNLPSRHAARGGDNLRRLLLDLSPRFFGWHCRPAWFRISAGLFLATAAFCALAQVHEARRGDLVLRSSTVASDRINPATAGKHGIEPSPTRGVLNVTVLRGPDGRTVPAEVAASSVNLAGIRQDIEMREVRADGRVSYVGSYDFLPREVIDFEITARPLRPANSRPLSLKYRDRMWAR